MYTLGFMREVNLAKYKVTDSVAWRLLAMGLAVGVLRIWDSLRAGLSPLVALIVTFSAIAALLFSGGLRRQSSIVVEQRTLKVTTSLFGRVIKLRQQDISNAAWVRARIIGSYQTQITVEVGTIGYITTELVRIAHKDGKGVPESEMLCARVAEILKIPNKGFKGLA